MQDLPPGESASEGLYASMSPADGLVYFVITQYGPFEAERTNATGIAGDQLTPQDSGVSIQQTSLPVEQSEFS
jgi:hypothetical protein